MGGIVSRPNCYQCKYRRELPGSAHSRCVHPDVRLASPLTEALSILAGARHVPLPPPPEAVALNVSGIPHGIARGWFSWPHNFDPTWLLTCDGFAAKDVPPEVKP